MTPAAKASTVAGLAVTGLSKAFGGVQAVKDVNGKSVVVIKACLPKPINSTRKSMAGSLQKATMVMTKLIKTT